MQKDLYYYKVSWSKNLIAKRMNQIRKKNAMKN